MPDFEIGRMRHRVTIMRDGSTSTGGQRTPAYAPIGTFYGLVECLGGSEATNANQLKGTLSYRVTMRASVGPIRPTDRLGWDGHTLNVTASTVDPMRIFVVVDAIEYPSPQ